MKQNRHPVHPGRLGGAKKGKFQDSSSLQAGATSFKHRKFSNKIPKDSSVTNCSQVSAVLPGITSHAKPAMHAMRLHEAMHRTAGSPYN